jgi:SNF2 family DNA or RNA helicase
MAAYIKRPCYTLVSELSLKARDECIKQFNASDRGVLMTTYNLGAEGLNIQSAHIVLLVDLWWNAAKTKQAIARVFRFGQQSPVVKVYYFTSNTGIEHAILDKHIDKVNALSELQTGSIKTNIKLINISNIIKILDVYDNVLHMTKLNKLS